MTGAMSRSGRKSTLIKELFYSLYPLSHKIELKSIKMQTKPAIRWILLQFIITQIIKYNVAKLLEVNKQTLFSRWILSSVFQPWTKLPRNLRKSENSSLLR